MGSNIYCVLMLVSWVAGVPPNHHLSFHGFSIQKNNHFWIPHLWKPLIMVTPSKWPQLSRICLDMSGSQRPKTAAQGQVSLSCEATTIHCSSSGIFHLRCWHPDFVSTASVQHSKTIPDNFTAVSRIHFRCFPIDDIRAQQNPEFGHPSSC